MENMYYLLVEKLAMGKYAWAYKNIKTTKFYWFEMDTHEKAIEYLHSIMTDGTYILKVKTFIEYKPLYKAMKHNDEITVLTYDL